MMVAGHSVIARSESASDVAIFSSVLGNCFVVRLLAMMKLTIGSLKYTILHAD